MDGTARDDLLSDTTVGSDNAGSEGTEDTAAVVEAALQLRWRAPELALLLAERAVAATGSGMAGTAELLAAASLNRLGREVEAGQRALTGLRRIRRVGSGASEGGLVRQLHVELAASAVAVGAVGAALAVLRPVLEAEPGAAPAVRATALVQLAAALTVLNRDDAAALALREADDLYQCDTCLEPIPAVLLRGTVRALRSSQHRRHGELAAAESAAREGLELLSELPSPADDGCAVGARLVLELVLALLDQGLPRAAARAAAAVVGSSVRAAAAAPRGWLHLALATRVHLPGGLHREALSLLGDAIDAARRHMLDPVLAECLDGQCRVHEERGEHAEALHCLRSAHAAGYRHRRASDELRIELSEEFGATRRDVAGLADQLTDLLGAGGTGHHSRPRHRSDGGQGFPVAELLLAAGRSGRAGPERRRAAEQPTVAGDTGDTEATAPTLVSKLPLDEIGLGHLLAEALAAFEEGRRCRGAVAGAVAEQVWQPPEADRHSAAGG